MKLLPILLTVGLLPFMVRIHGYNTGLDEFSWYYVKTDPLFGDTFLFWRQWVFTGITFYMFFVLLGKLIWNRKSLRLSITALPMGIYALFALLSSIFSKYPKFCFGGSFEQFENVFVLMGYALIVYYSFIILETEQDVKIILYTLAGSTLLLSFIGTLQTVGWDFYTTRFAKWLLSPIGVDASYTPTMGAGRAYLSLYNPNYVGVYVTILFPLFAVLIVFSRKWWQMLVYGMTCIFLLISLYGSGSKAGFLVLAGLLVIFIILMRRPIFKRWYIIIPVFTLCLVTFLLINHYRNNEYIDAIKAALKIHKTEYDLQEMSTEKDGVHITYKGEKLIISTKMEGDMMFFHFVDKDDNFVDAEMLEDMLTFRINDKRFEGFEIYPVYVEYDRLVLCFSIRINGEERIFTNQYDDKGTYYYYTDKGRFDQMIMAETVLFGDYQGLFSGRGYIWSITIPLLKKTIFLGSGPDTFLTVFPHQDYLRFIRISGPGIILTKPHCLYLQVGVQTGVISLIALLAFFIMYGVSCIRLYINSRFETFYEQLGVAIFLSVIGFAVTGLSNDSSVTVSPIFWAIAGLGVFVNSKCKEMKKEKLSTK